MSGTESDESLTATATNMEMIHVGGDVIGERSDDEAMLDGDAHAAAGADTGPTKISEEHKLGAFLGVYVPCIMSIFGVILFLRMGWVVGQAGFWGTCGIIAASTIVALLTIFSVSAISTNGEIAGGGLYFMISRSLGCEFGGSTGILFFVANVAAGALYMIGFAETVASTFEVEIGSKYWTQVVIASSVLVLVFLVAIAGASWFVKVSFGIFVVLVASIAAGFISLLVMPEDRVGGFTGPSTSTFYSNLSPEFVATDGIEATFPRVFGVFFPAVTGIMAGANMSGDLKSPSQAIPKGTLASFGTAIVVYFGLAIAFAATVGRTALVENNLIMQEVCFWPPAISIGIACSTLSSALGSVVGGARILQAISRDNLLPFLSPFKRGYGRNDEPRRAVIVTWILVQALILVGSLNVLANVTSMFFLLSYAIINLAVFIMRVSGAPNFRPLFKMYSWQQAILGFVLCTATMFIVDPIYASIASVILIIVFALIHFIAPPTQWGSVSQALIYHQVRKFLLRLDVAKEHVKYWRPQLLLLVDEPRQALNLIDFANNVKKGGLYVLGNVVIGDLGEKRDAIEKQQSAFLSFVGSAKIKAFAEVIPMPDFRLGASTLALASGLGAMKPNTVMMGFFRPRDLDSESGTPMSNAGEEDGSDELGKKPSAIPPGLQRRRRRSTRASRREPLPLSYFKPFRHCIGAMDNFLEKADSDCLPVREYFGVVQDMITLGKNVLLCRGFNQLDKSLLVGFSKHKKNRMTSNGGKAVPRRFSIDVWLSWEADDWSAEGATELLQMQFAHIVGGTDIWKSHTSLRIITVVTSSDKIQLERARIAAALRTARIPAEIKVVVLEEARPPHFVKLMEADAPRRAIQGSKFEITDLARSDRYLIGNELIQANSSHTAVLFLSLPRPPADEDAFDEFGFDLDVLTRHLPPTVLVFGSKSVINTHQ